MQWYVSQNGKTTGPFDEERLAMLVHWGKISRDAFICDKQWSAWIAIRRSAFAQLLPGEERRGVGSSARAGEESEPAPADSGQVLFPRWGWLRAVEQGTRQALGLVALSVILAGLLMATL
jgi:uncharacterized protein DUF4339